LTLQYTLQHKLEHILKHTPQHTPQHTATGAILGITSVVMEAARADTPSDDLKVDGEVEGWGRDPKKYTGSMWGMGSSTI